MISSSNSIFFKLILILTMSFSWITEVFGNIETKKAVSTVKKGLKFTYKSFSLRKNNGNEPSRDRFYVKSELSLTKEPVKLPLNFTLYFNDRLIQANVAAPNKLTMQLLYPNHD